MSKTFFVGIDNGVSGSIGVVDENGKYIDFRPTPVFLTLDYTKLKRSLHRVDTKRLREFWVCTVGLVGGEDNVRVYLERPLVCPKRFFATCSSMRAMEATLISLESLSVAYRFIDSREWQIPMLPQGCKGEALKKASMDIGKRLFPKAGELIDKQKDADGLLIAEAARRGKW